MKRERLWLIAAAVIVVIIIGGLIGTMIDKKPNVLQTTASNAGTSSGHPVVPWDYQVSEAKAGDLIGDEMVILPSNQLITNDQNYATGDQIYVLNFMSAEMSTDAAGGNQVNLSAWKPIKTFKTKEDAAKDMAELKNELKTELDLVGVYKTELQGKFRYFAVVNMPTGQAVKQPIPEVRYNSFKNKKKVQAVVEEVHDFSDFDLTMAKFRGWAE